MSDDSDQAELPTLPVSTVRANLADPKTSPTPFRGSMRYREQGLLGKGGMGEVRLFEDGIVGRGIAVKTIAAKLGGDRGIRDRFVREARIQGQLEHPSIVPVYDLGVDDAGNDYFTMRRITGRTLRSVIDAIVAGDRATLSAFPRNALYGVLRQICLAVAYAHSRGVIHRDLKPANMMVGDFGEVYVLDWGLAAIAGEPSVAADEGEILGTPGYMAPEQIANAATVDARADVYSLGAILFELLTLERWHPAETQAAIADTIAEECAMPLKRAPSRDIPPELDELCSRATLRERDERLPTAREFAEVLERYLQGDRDLERRREQADEHLTAALAARARVADATDGAVDARREALRQAGRAMALDPTNRDASRLALELMLEPPPHMPVEVENELARTQSDRIRAGIIPGLVVFTVFLILVLGLPLISEGTSWTMPMLIAASVAVAILTSGSRLLKQDLARSSIDAMVVATAILFAIACSSTYLGPMIMIPPLALALANALVSSQLRWKTTFVLGLAAVVVPFVLEWAGVTPRNYEFTGGTLVVRSHVMQLSEVPVRITNLATTLVALIGSVLYVARVVRVEKEVRGRWLLQNWHLRQMAQLTD